VPGLPASIGIGACDDFAFDGAALDSFHIGCMSVSLSGLERVDIPELIEA